VPGVEPVAWVDLDVVARQRAVVELGLPQARVFADLGDAMRAVGADAALVVVPLAGHVAATADALERGLHVLVEKPFAPTPGEAHDLVALAARRRLALMVSQNYRWFAAPRLARQLLRAGAIGTAVSVQVDFHHHGAGHRYLDLAEPLLGDMAIHHLDALRFVLDDEPVDVSCTSWGEPRMPFGGPPAALATIRFAGGTIVGYGGSWISRGPPTPWAGQWRIDGAGGRIDLAWRGDAGQREAADRLDLHAAEATPLLPALALTDRRGALDAFAAWVRDGVPPEGASTAADNIRSLALMEAAIRSSHEGGAWVRVADLLAEAGE
jgi:predicted dehydrogenase